MVWQNVFTSTSTDFTVKPTNEDANIAKELEKLNEQSKKENFTASSLFKLDHKPAIIVTPDLEVPKIVSEHVK
jgi:hypothetical protein